MTIGRIKNWSKFQHYKDRAPPWIKLHRELLDNIDYHMLSGEAAKALPLLWLIASESDGSIPPPEVVAFRLRVSLDSAQAIVQELGYRGFLTDEHVEHVATHAQPQAKERWPSRHIPDKTKRAVFERDGGKCVWCGSVEHIEYDHITPVSKGGTGALSNIQLLCRGCNRKKRTRDAAQAEQLATDILSTRSLEGEGETEGETEITNPNGLVVPEGSGTRCPHADIIALYHETLPSLARVREWTDARQALLRKRWAEKPERQTLDWWRDFFGYVERSDFLMGRKASRGSDPFECDLEWLIRPRNFVKVIEGKYENRGAAA
jgi:hypothetical protein